MLPALFRVPDCDLVARWVGGGEHSLGLVSPLHGVSVLDQSFGDGGRVLDVDAQTDMTGRVTMPELNSGVTEPQAVGTVRVKGAAEELVKIKRRCGIGYEHGHVSEHNGF